MKCVSLVGFLVVLAVASAAYAQPQHAKEVQRALERLSFLEGKWSGEGTLTMGPGQAATARVTETATFRLDKTLFMLEGKGTAKFPNGSRRNVHDAIGLISFDAEHGEYRFRTYRAGGETLDPSIQVKDDGIVWNFPQGGRTIRFTATVKDNVWTEIGESSPDKGKTWYRFFDMKLRRVTSEAGKLGVPPVGGEKR